MNADTSTSISTSAAPALASTGSVAATTDSQHGKSAPGVQHGLASLPQALQLTVVTVNGVVFAGEAYYVSVPGEDGRIGILPGHDPVLALLKAGELRFVPQRGASPQQIAILGGMVEAGTDNVTVLADHAAHTATADTERQQAARQRAGQLAATPVRRHAYAGLKAELDAELLRFFELILRGF